MYANELLTECTSMGCICIIELLLLLIGGFLIDPILDVAFTIKIMSSKRKSEINDLTLKGTMHICHSEYLQHVCYDAYQMCPI